MKILKRSDRDKVTFKATEEYGNGLRKTVKEGNISEHLFKCVLKRSIQ